MIAQVVLKRGNNRLVCRMDGTLEHAEQVRDWIIDYLRIKHKQRKAS